MASVTKLPPETVETTDTCSSRPSAAQASQPPHVERRRPHAAARQGQADARRTPVPGKQCRLFAGAGSFHARIPKALARQNRLPVRTVDIQLGAATGRCGHRRLDSCVLVMF